MDRSLELRLNSATPFYEAALYQKLASLALDYVRNGLATLNYYLPEFDAAYDLANALAQLPSGTNLAAFDKIEKSASRNFSHPAGATQVTVLATAVSQILFGGEVNRRVEPRNADDQPRSDATNQLLAWNDQQNNLYADGYLWTLDAIIANRGIWYDHWSPQHESTKEPVEYDLPFVPKRFKNGKWSKQPLDWKPEKATRWRTTTKEVGGFTKLSLISPYDFISDPTIPLSRFQESRYAGHRVILSWQELERRSKLPPDHYDYVLPEVVKRIKNQKARRGITAVSPTSTSVSTSRNFFDRLRRTNPVSDVGLTDKVNKSDGGTIECWCITIRLRPKEHEIYEDDTNELCEFLIAGETDLLSVNVMTNQHAEYPYAIGEARPQAHQQFGPSWASLMKPTQNYIDTLKSAHAEQVERCGSIFLGDPDKCDVEAVLTDKDRVRQLVLKTQDAGQTPNEQILQQIDMKDPTKDFPAEMQFWEAVMEKTSGATAPVQGQTEDPSQTLGQYQDVQQMAMGRLSTIARNLSTRALVPQTRHIVMNMQQWMPDKQTIRITGKNAQEYNPDEPPPKYLTVRREPYTPEEKAANQKALAEYQMIAQQAQSQGLPVPEPPPELDQPDIQFQFDVIPHDGAMPGVDAKAVAAATRLIEASSNPAFAACFVNTVPGNLDPKALLVYVAEKSGLPMTNFLITRETAQKNLQAQQEAAGMTLQPPGGQAPAPGGAMPPGQQEIQMPGIPPATPPQATGAVLPPPQL